MFTTVVRRTGALVVAGAVAGAVLVPVSANAATAAPARPPRGPTTGPSAGAASWIAGQLEDGLLPGQFGPEYPDYGLTIDAGLSTVAVGGDDAVVQQIAAAIAENLESYITGEDFGDVGSTYAGAAGKALTFAQAAGADPTDFGGVDLVARVEGVTDDASGRITDVSDVRRQRQHHRSGLRGAGARRGRQRRGRRGHRLPAGPAVQRGLLPARARRHRRGGLRRRPGGGRGHRRDRVRAAGPARAGR